MTGSIFRREDFQLTVEDVFAIAGRGTVATGQVASGAVGAGDRLVVLKPDGRQLATTCTGVEMYRKVLPEARSGDNVGLLLDGLSKEDVATGDVLRSAARAAQAVAPAVAPPPSPPATVPGGLSLRPEVAAEVKRLVAEGKKIEAIKVLREHTGLGLKEAKDVVDLIGPGGLVTLLRTSGSYGDEPSPVASPTAPSSDVGPVLAPYLQRYGAPGIAVEAEAEIMRLVVMGEKITAIKALRDASPQLGLREAKEVVEAAGQALGAPPAVQPSGCLIALVALARLVLR